MKFIFKPKKAYWRNLLFTLLFVIQFCQSSIAQSSSLEVILPNKEEFSTWEIPLIFSKTYYVDNQNPKASDENKGTKDSPFLTINKAAQVLQPRERVVIMEGVYREKIVPQFGGESPDKMISYEVAPGAKVIVKGSRLIKNGWKKSSGFIIGQKTGEGENFKIYQVDLENIEFNGYNPFGLLNIMMNREYLNTKLNGLSEHLLRRGIVFVDGKRLDQVEMYRDMAGKDGTYWSEHNGMVVHVRLPNDEDPASHQVELAIQEQVFAPKKQFLGFIRIKGITFEHAANAFPIPQHGLVSTNKGHHWIIEDCDINNANSIGLDIGSQDWTEVGASQKGYMIVRRNHISDAGVCGLAGMGVVNTLIENNLIEHIGWHDAELAWESGGIKLHGAKNCLLRNNIIRHLTNAPGIWLDYGTENTRVTCNVIGDVKKTIRGGIYLEASHYQNMIDHNIIWDVTRGKTGPAWDVNEGGWGIIIDGSDETIIAHNLIGKCEYAALRTRTHEARIVETRGGTAFWNNAINNIFYDSGKSIYFSHKDNMADGNFYAMPQRDTGRGLNWIDGNEIIRVDLPAWQKYFGFDKNGKSGKCVIDVDIDALTLSISNAENVPMVKTIPFFKSDFTGNRMGDQRLAGPINSLVSGQIIDIKVH